MRIKNDKKGFFMIIEGMIFMVIIFMLSFITISTLSAKAEISNNTKIEDSVDKPSSPKQTQEEKFYVLDNADLLSGYTSKRIAEKSKQLDLHSKAQIIVETLETMNGQDIETYTSNRFRELGLGDKELNNGVLLVVVPIEKTARIEVGYGLEGAIPDGKLGNIIREQG